MNSFKENNLMVDKDDDDDVIINKCCTDFVEMHRDSYVSIVSDYIDIVIGDVERRYLQCAECKTRGGSSSRAVEVIRLWNKALKLKASKGDNTSDDNCGDASVDRCCCDKCKSRGDGCGHALEVIRLWKSTLDRLSSNALELKDSKVDNKQDKVDKEIDIKELKRDGYKINHSVYFLDGAIYLYGLEPIGQPIKYILSDAKNIYGIDTKLYMDFNDGRDIYLLCHDTRETIYILLNYLLKNQRGNN